MKPLGRFFQVTETLDFKKYFLDIEKIERYPLSFVVKSEESIDELLAKIKADALKTYVVQKVVDDYLSCIEEVINIPVLKSAEPNTSVRVNLTTMIDGQKAQDSKPWRFSK